MKFCLKQCRQDRVEGRYIGRDRAEGLGEEQTPRLLPRPLAALRLVCLVRLVHLTLRGFAVPSASEGQG